MTVNTKHPPQCGRHAHPHLVGPGPTHLDDVIQLLQYRILVLLREPTGKELVNLLRGERRERKKRC